MRKDHHSEMPTQPKQRIHRAGWLPTPSRRLSFRDYHFASVGGVQVGAEKIQVSVVEKEIIYNPTHKEWRIAEVLFETDTAGQHEFEPSGLVVPVDSGGIVVFDPSFEPRWNERRTAACATTYFHSDINVPGNHWYCSLHDAPPPAFRGHAFGHFTQPLPEFGGLCVNELVEQGMLQGHTAAVNADEFSSEGAFATQMVSPHHFGLLCLDRQPVAFSCMSGFGDGCYEVEIAKHAARIVFIDEEDDENN